MTGFTAIIPKTLEVIRCRSCRRRLTLSTKRSAPQYCDELCASDYPAVDNEDRNALIEVLARCEGISQQTLAQQFGMTRQMVNLILHDRKRIAG